MVINLKDKTALIPRNEKGDPAFVLLNGDPRNSCACRSVNQLVDTMSVLAVFTPEEVTELVNRALYQIEYQKTSHRKRGQKLRDVEKALKEELKKQGLDVKVTEIKNQLEGKK